MPIYEYRCSECGHLQEHLQKVSAPLLTTCPACGRETYSKQLTAAGFQLKGSGWYATDFKGGSQKSAVKGGSGTAADTKSDSKADTKADTKSDTKSDAKSDAKTESKTEAKSSTPTSGGS